MNITPKIQKGGAAVAAKPEEKKGNDLSKALAGVKAPTGPESQKISSPGVPAARAMPAASQVAALLAQMTGQAATPAPLRLGQILGGR